MNTQYNTQLHSLSAADIYLLINDLFLTPEYKGTFTVTNNDLLNFAYAILRRAGAVNPI